MNSLDDIVQSTNEIYAEKVYDQAVKYLQNGFALLPLAARRKHPNFSVLARVHGTFSWTCLRSVPATEGDIARWLEVDADLNLGVITGEASGNLVVLDYDSRWDAILVDTPTVSTGRGIHIYTRAA